MNYENCGKRLFDFICATVGFAIISPFLVLAAILIKLDSKGPVFSFNRGWEKMERFSGL